MSPAGWVVLVVLLSALGAQTGGVVAYAAATRRYPQPRGAEMFQIVGRASLGVFSGTFLIGLMIANSLELV